MKILIYAQFPRGTMPRRSLAAYQVVGVTANPIPPSPLPPGKGGGGGGHYGSEHNYIIDRRRHAVAAERAEVEDLSAVLLMWLLITNGMPWMAPKLTVKQAAAWDAEVLPFLMCWLSAGA